MPFVIPNLMSTYSIFNLFHFATPHPFKLNVTPTVSNHTRLQVDSDVDHLTRDILLLLRRLLLLLVVVVYRLLLTVVHLWVSAL